MTVIVCSNFCFVFLMFVMLCNRIFGIPIPKMFRYLFSMKFYFLQFVFQQNNCSSLQGGAGSRVWIISIGATCTYLFY